MAEAQAQPSLPPLETKTAAKARAAAEAASRPAPPKKPGRGARRLVRGLLLVGFTLLSLALAAAYPALARGSELLYADFQNRWLLLLLLVPLFFYRSTWGPWGAVARRFGDRRRREGFIAFYGPLSLLVLLALWACGLVLGFALLQWSVGSALDLSTPAPL